MEKKVPKSLPRILRSKYIKDQVIKVDPITVIPFMAGFFIESGSFKGRITLNNGNIREINFPTNSLILDEGYVTESGGQLNRWTKTNFQLMATKGWELIVMEENTTSLCLVYKEFIIPNSTIEKPIKEEQTGLGVKINKLPYENYPQVYNFYKIKEEKDIFVPKNDHLLLIKGTALINYVEKKAKTWIRSSKDQYIKVQSKDENDEVLIFLLETNNETA